MNNSPPQTMSGWSFGSQSPVPLPQATPTLVPRRQIPVGAPAVLRPRNLFPGLPNSPFLSGGPRFFAVADPNAPPAGLAPVIDHMILDVPPVIPVAPVEVPFVLPPVVVAPVAPVAAPVAPVDTSHLVLQLQNQVQHLQSIIMASGGSRDSSSLHCSFPI